MAATNGIAGAHRPDHRQQPLEDGIVERDRDQSEHGDRAQAHDQRAGLAARARAEARHDPLLVRHETEQDARIDGAVEPVEDDQDAQDDVARSAARRMKDRGIGLALQRL